ncbi:glycosyltransferase family 4 protein [Cyclobacterium salsum]|uniref:glycosyltransferase family 4 protein n=1 Tax=Cyclobacterium salsum TaxID=2666329 RepID=UPI00192F0A89|nr:glycosyltransferase family 4 protein [Cyclobacterium salsum]
MSWPNLFIKKPLVVALRTWIGRTDGSMGWQDKFKMHWLKRAAASIAVSEAVRLETWPKATVIGNPYRSEVFRIIPEVEKNLGLVFLGRLVSDKGADLAIRAIKLLIRETQKTSDPAQVLALTVVGDGPERLPLEGLANELGIAAHVTFKGNLVGEDLVHCLNQHKILLVPSIWAEPFGNVVLEGMACGCIPIVSDRGGLPGAAGKAGLTFTSGNVNALVETIQSILNNPSLEENLRNASAEHLQSHYPDVVAQKYLAIIKSVTKSKC